MANGWTLERRARQAVLIQEWKPWDRSTGPKTNEGKARSAMRGYKGDQRSVLRELRQIMNDADEVLNALAVPFP